MPPAPRKRFEAVQTRKTVSGTAAPGSLLETTDGSLLVLPFEKWPFFINNQHLNQENEVLDARFRQRLQRLYQNLKKLVRVPTNETKHNFALSNVADDNDVQVLKGRYFPEWAYCPFSHKLQHIQQWQAAWEAAGPSGPNRPRDRNNFNPPKSTVVRPTGQFPRNQALEQMRFVLAGPNGELADVPWNYWVFAQLPEKQPVRLASGQQMRATMLNFAQPLPTGCYLHYEAQGGDGHLGGIVLTARKNSDDSILKDENDKPYRTNLAGLYNLRVSRADLVNRKLLFEQSITERARPGDEYILFRPVIRSSNSMYYANTLDSLFIPTELAQISSNLVEKLHNQYKLLSPQLGASLTPALLRNLLGPEGERLTDDYIAQLIAADFKFTEAVDDAAEQMYRQAEFAFFTAHLEEIYPTDGRKPEMSFRRVEVLQAGLEGITSVRRVDKLKVVTVQPSYTRLTPLPTDAVLRDDEYSANQPNQPASYEEGILPRKHFVTLKGVESQYLPAYESYGEGLFFQFSASQLAEWEKQLQALEMQGEFKQMHYLIHNHGQAWLVRDTAPPTASQVLIHTFSHLLMRELEFRCGYPLTSLKERLYVGPDMQGLLIYTVAGSAGSFGGLVSLTDDNQLDSLVRSALHRATDCAADPICWHTDEQGQGVGGLNMASCASCTLLPETSCEEFNSLLDRRLVVDPGFGYFRELLQ